MPPKQTPVPTQAPKVFDFLVKVLITAIVRNKAGHEEKIVRETVFQLDKASAEKPWFVLKNFLVPKFLNSSVGPEGAGWVKIYEIKILKLVNRKNPNEVDGIPLRVMDLGQLELYCKKWEYPVKPKLFHSVETARQYIALFEEDPAGYEVQLKKYLDGGARKYPEMDDLRRNADKYLGDSAALASEFEGLNQKPAEPEGVLPTTEDLPPAPEVPTETEQPAVQNKPAASRKAQIKADKLKKEKAAANAVPAPAPAEESTPEVDPFSAV